MDVLYLNFQTDTQNQKENVHCTKITKAKQSVCLAKDMLRFSPKIYVSNFLSLRSFRLKDNVDVIRCFCFLCYFVEIKDSSLSMESNCKQKKKSKYSFRFLSICLNLIFSSEFTKLGINIKGAGSTTHFYT